MVLDEKRISEVLLGAGTRGDIDGMEAIEILHLAELGFALKQNFSGDLSDFLNQTPLSGSGREAAELEKHRKQA